MAESTPAYVAFCQACSGMSAAVVDDGKDPKGVAKFLGPVMRRGDRVERKTVGFVQTFEGEWCDCSNGKARPLKGGQLGVGL